MVSVSSDNPDTEKRMVRLCDALEKAGSYIDDDASIMDVGGGTSVFVSDAYDSEFLFKLRHEHLIPYDHFDFDIEGDDIVIAHHDRNDNPFHLDMLEQMIGLYNESGKFTFHRNTHPFLQYDSSPELVKHLMRGRQGQSVDVIGGMLGKAEFFDELVLLTFFNSRLLNSRLYSKDSKQSAVLIPIMEFMNHHHAGATFENLYSKKSNVLSVQAIMPVSGSRECFTRYGRFDSLDTYLHYGFVDEGAPYVRSVPLRLDLDGVGTILIGSNSSNIPIQDIPAYLRDLAFYFPRTSFSKGHKVVELSHLFIPGEKARFSMRRILAYVIQALEPSIDEASCHSYVEDVERQILKLNIEYYDEIKPLTVIEGKKATIGSDVLALCEVQIKKISHYDNLVNPL